MILIELTNTANMEKLFGKLTRDENPKASIIGTVSKVKKSAIVRAWTMDISLVTYRNQITTQDKLNYEVPQNRNYYDFIESLKTKKDIKGLPTYVNNHILRICENKEDQLVVEVLVSLKRKYECT